MESLRRLVFKDAAVKEIRDLISHSSVMDSGFMSALPRSKQKAVAIYDVKQMNELLLVLYEKNILIPISLKKATASGPGVLCLRVELVLIMVEKIKIINQKTQK